MAGSQFCMSPAFIFVFAILNEKSAHEVPGIMQLIFKNYAGVISFLEKLGHMLFSLVFRAFY